MEALKVCLDYSWLIILFPFLSFVLISLVTIRKRMISAYLSVLALFCSFLVSLGSLIYRLATNNLEPFQMHTSWVTIFNFHIEAGILIDNLTTIMLMVVSFVGFLIQVYSIGYMEEEKDASFSRYFAYMSLFACSMLGLVLSNNFLQIYVFWELVGLCSYLLIGFWYQKPSAAAAAKKAFVVTRFGDMGFLAGIILLSFNAGTFNFLQLQSWVPTVSTILLLKVSILIFCGAVGKSAQFPLHIWLPDAMEGPTPVSALIHAATMVTAGVYLVARSYFLFSANPAALLIVAIIGAITAFIAASIALVQMDIKKVLAYSTISQLGYMMLALGVGGYSAGSFHLMTHGFFKALLFLGAGSVIHALHTNDLSEMGGLGKKMRITGTTFLIGCLAIAGIFPFSGFFSKDEILAAVSTYAVDPSISLPAGFVFVIPWLLKIIAYGVVIMTAFYMFRMYYLAFCGEFRGHHEPRKEMPVMTVPLIILAFFSAIVGFIGTPWKNLYGEYVKFGEAVAEHINYPAIIFSLAIALLGIYLAKIIYKDGVIKHEELRTRFSSIYNLLVRKYYMDEIWYWLMQKTMFLGAAIASWIDENIVDGIVNAVGYITAWFAVKLRYEHTGRVQNYALAILLGVILVLLALSFLEPDFALNYRRFFIK